jgi:hypothetical protein
VLMWRRQYRGELQEKLEAPERGLCPHDATRPRPKRPLREYMPLRFSPQIALPISLISESEKRSNQKPKNSVLVTMRPAAHSAQRDFFGSLARLALTIRSPRQRGHLTVAGSSWVRCLVAATATTAQRVERSSCTCSKMVAATGEINSLESLCRRPDLYKTG